MNCRLEIVVEGWNLAHRYNTFLHTYFITEYELYELVQIQRNFNYQNCRTKSHLLKMNFYKILINIQNELGWPEYTKKEENRQDTKIYKI